MAGTGVELLTWRLWRPGLYPLHQLVTRWRIHYEWPFGLCLNCFRLSSLVPLSSNCKYMAKFKSRGKWWRFEKIRRMDKQIVHTPTSYVYVCAQKIISIPCFYALSACKDQYQIKHTTQVIMDSICRAEIMLVISIERDLIKLKLPSYSCWCHHLLTTMLRWNHSNFNSWDFSHILLKLSTWIYKIFRKVLVQSKIYPPLQFFPYSN